MQRFDSFLADYPYLANAMMLLLFSGGWHFDVGSYAFSR